jgi:glycosyltransferase involved in cell wall biosynthesis
MEERSVLMLAFLFPPTAAAGTFRTLRFVKYLRECEWKPLVVTVPPDCTMYGEDPTLAKQVPPDLVVRRTRVWYPDETLSSLLKTLRCWNGKASDAGSNHLDPPSTTATQLRTGPVRGLGQLLRNARDLALFTPDPFIAWIGAAVRASLDIRRKHHPRLLYSTSPPHSTQLIGLMLKKITRLPWVIDFRDPWARTAWGESAENPWGRRMNSLLERMCVFNADAVILNTDAMKREFCRQYPNRIAEKCIVIPNGYDPEDRQAVEQTLASPAENRGSRIRICHPGALYGRRDPRPFLMALKQLIEGGTNVAFEQIGGVGAEFALERFIEERGLQNHVTITNGVDHETVLRRMAEANLLLAIQPGTDRQVPGKLFEMMLFRKPIVALTDAGETSEIITRYELGQVADPKIVPDIATAIQRAGHHPAIASEGWKIAMATYDGRALTQRLADVFRAVSARDSASLCRLSQPFGN